MVGIDTDVLLLAFSFHHDKRQEINTQFLTSAAREQNPIVAIFTVMELLGQLSFNLAPHRLESWQIWLADEFHLSISYPDLNAESVDRFFEDQFIQRPLRKMHQRMPYLDALILDLMERIPSVEVFVTWNAHHFYGKTALAVQTPAEFMLNG